MKYEFFIDYLHTELQSYDFMYILKNNTTNSQVKDVNKQRDTCRDRDIIINRIDQC